MNLAKVRKSLAYTKRAHECGVCGMQFTVTGDKVPRLLHCGHSFCHSCLTRLPIEDGVLFCPMDRQITCVSDGGVWCLKKNFALIELMEQIEYNENIQELHGMSLSNHGLSASNLKRDLVEDIKCDEDDSHTATIYCMVCDTNLCDGCSQLTHSTKTLSKHRRIGIEDKPAHAIMCPLHQTYALEFVCLEINCSTNPTMCFLCKEHGRHKGHKSALIDTEANNLKVNAQNLVEMSQSFLTRVSGHACKLVADIQRIEGGTRFSANQHGALSRHNETGTAESARSCIREYFQQLREELDRQEQVALTTLDSHIRGALTGLRQAHDKVTSLQTQITAAIVHCNRLLEKSSYDLVTSRSEVSTIRELLEQQERSFEVICSEKTDAAIPVTFTKDNRVHIGPKLEIRVVTLGLDGAGKTTLLFKLKQNEFMQHIPTIGFNVETLDYHNLRFTVWDVGGKEKLRPLWKHYHFNTQAIMFVVDASDPSRFDEAHVELVKLMSEKDLRDAALLVLANKQDLPGAVSYEELSTSLNLHKLCCGRVWKAIGCDARSGVGLDEGLQWLSRQLVAARVLEVS